MNPVSELLAGLRDIHLPAAVSWWPPAPLWWWSLAALAVAAALSVAAAVALRRRRERAATLPACRLALRELGVLRRRFFAGGNARDLLAGLSVLLRRTAISLSPRAETAALTGDAWLAWLDARAGEFAQNTGRLFESLAIDSELIDLRAQVERRLKQLEEHRAKSDSNVWDLVARMEQPLSNCKSCRVDLLDFKQQEILLEVSIAGDPQQLKRLFEKLPGAQATHNDLPDQEDRKRVRFQVKPL